MDATTIESKALTVRPARSGLKTKDRNVESDCRAFGRRMQAAMRKVDLTQADISRTLKLSRSAVNWWANGDTYPSIDHAKKLAALLRTTPEYLVFGAKNVVKERLVDSIPVIDRISGHQSEMTRIAIPSEFLTRANLPDSRYLRAVTVLSKQTVKGYRIGDIAIVDTSDRKLSARKNGLYILDNGEVTTVANVRKAPKDHIRVQTDSETFEMPFTQGMIVGKVVAHLAQGG